MSKTFAAVATFLGTIIGAGILGIPYVVMKAGFGIGVLTMVLVALILLLVYLYLGEIGLRTRENHQLTGYAEMYLGKKGKKMMFLAFAFGIYSALVAYLIGEGESLSFIVYGTTSYAADFAIAFWILLSAISYFGLKALEDGEEIGVMFVVIMILSIILLYSKKIDYSNLSYNNPSLFYLPFGVIMFAFLGFAAIPELERILKLEKHKTKRVIFITMIAVLLIYVIFTAVVVGSQGANTPELATIVLGKPFVLLGIFTMFTAYLALTTALINTFRLDFKKSRAKSWLYTVSVPLIVYLLLNYFDKISFIKVLTLGGIVSGLFLSVLVLLMVKKAKFHGNRKPEYSIPYSKFLTLIIILVLAVGAVLEIVNLF